MRILVVENEYMSVKGAFEASNKFDFNSQLIIEDVGKSQDVDFAKIENYNVIFIDISLASKSKLDGIGLLEKINSQAPGVMLRTVILTGDHNIEEKLKEKNLLDKKLKILKKPINFKDVSSIIQSITGD